MFGISNIVHILFDHFVLTLGRSSQSLEAKTVQCNVQRLRKCVTCCSQCIPLQDQVYRSTDTGRVAASLVQPTLPRCHQTRQYLFLMT